MISLNIMGLYFLKNLSPLKKCAVYLCAFFIAWILYFGFAVSDIATFRGGDFYLKTANIWADWAMHYTQITQFAYRSMLPDTHPLLEGAGYTYPFVVNWISALFVKMGFSVFTAPVLITFILSIACVVAITLLYLSWAPRLRTALIAVCLFFMNGGLGALFLWFPQWLEPDVAQKLLSNMHAEATHIPELGIRWINIISSMLLPQRAFSLGFPVAIIALLLITRECIKHLVDWKARNLFWAGLLAGLLPAFHMHSYLCLGLVCAWLVLVTGCRHRKSKRDLYLLFKRWMLVAGPALVLGLPWILYFYKSTFSGDSEGFIRWFPGWLTHSESEFPGMSILKFWFLNSGLLLPLAVVGIFYLPRALRGIVFGFFVLFIACNLFLFQPYHWDNTKILVWANIGLSIAAAATVDRMFASELMWKKATALLLFGATTMSGFYDALRLIDGRTPHFKMYTKSDLGLVLELREIADKNDTLVTGTFHNNPLINLAGLNILLGYKGWLWTHGLNYHPIDSEIRALLSGDPEVFSSIREKYDVRYVAFDRDMINEWKGDEGFFKNRFPIILQNERFRIYQVAP